MSTPDGKFKSRSASMISWFGLMTSITRLCTRISNCSLAFLCTKLERLTVYLRISVGSGTGPTTSTPERLAMSIICRTELSMILWSYAFSLMRNLGITESAAGLAAFGSFDTSFVTGFFTGIFLTLSREKFPVGNFSR